MMPLFHAMHELYASIRRWLHLPFLGICGAILAFFVLFGVWLIADLQQGYRKVLADTSYRAMQRSQIIGHSFRTKVLSTDYVLRDVLGRIDARDIVYPDKEPKHIQRMTTLLQEKADTVPDFFSMVIFNQDCVFTATFNGKNVGVQSKPALCQARQQHTSPDTFVSYVPSAQSASGEPVLVLSRHLRSATGVFQGGVLGVIELKQAQRWLDSLSFEQGDSVALLDVNQVLLARHPASPHDIGKRTSTPRIPAALHAAPTTAATQRDVDGRERLFGFSTIAGFPFVVAYSLDQSQALEEWRRRAIELGMVYIILLLLAWLVMRYQWTILRQREQLRSSEKHFRMLAENMADIVWRTDAKLCFTYINTADQQLRGFTRDEVIGSSIQDNITPLGQEILQEQLHQRQAIEMANQQGGALKYEIPMRHKNDGEVWIEVSSVPVYASDGRIKGYQGIGRDVSARKQQEAQLLQSHQQLENQLRQAATEKTALQELATRDGLTGLYNRRYLNDALPRECARARRDGQPLALIMFDLDHFKQVNDQYGHAAGDEVLKTLAELLKKGVRESDLICRYGGEEFVAVMPNMSASQAWTRVESWRQQLQEMVIVVADFRIHITLSAGMAVFPEHGDNPDQLLTRADEMLYQSKEQGRNRISVYPSN